VLGCGEGVSSPPMRERSWSPENFKVFLVENTVSLVDTFWHTKKILPRQWGGGVLTPIGTPLFPMLEKQNRIFLLNFTENNWCITDIQQNYRKIPICVFRKVCEKTETFWQHCCQ